MTIRSQNLSLRGGCVRGPGTRQKSGVYTRERLRTRAPIPFTTIEVRLLKRDGPGLLKSMSLTVLTPADLAIVGMPVKLVEISGADIAAIDREKALVLKCTYQGEKGGRTKVYWFDRAPRHVQDQQVNPALQPYFARIAEGLSSCPARG